MGIFAAFKAVFSHRHSSTREPAPVASSIPATHGAEEFRHPAESNLDSYYERMRQYYQEKYSRLGFSDAEIETIIMVELEDR